MLGAAGALLCLSTGTVLGLAARDRRHARLRLLQAEMDVLAGMRLMLSEERFGMGELLARCSELVPGQPHAQRMTERFRMAAEELGKAPLEGVAGAYCRASAALPIPWEKAEEREALNALFAQLGSGTAAMREQATATCLRRLKPLCDQAQKSAEESGKLCVRLGLLMGLMAGIALW
ncbi:MAG: hypothetical protein RSB91_09535 [Clostridia bacterium]